MVGPGPGTVWGDVHIQTLDGEAYDLQAAGEFVAARSLDGSFEVQIRTAPWQGSDRVSVATAAGARVNGTRVTLAAGEHTGATPGRFVRGPGWTGNE